MKNPLPKKNPKERDTAPMPAGGAPTGQQTDQTVPPETRTYVALVLDSSGSMAQVRDDAIGGFNTNVAEIKKNADLGGRTFVSLVIFGGPPDSRPRLTFVNMPPEHLAPLTPETYRPFGNTPMLDAIGLALSTLQPFDTDNPTIDAAFLVTVVTDGYENASREWTGEKLAALIEQLEARGNWTITLVGANIDLAKIMRMTGIRQAAAYTSTRQGTRRAMDAQAAAASSYFADRSMGRKSKADLYDGHHDLSAAGASAALRVKASADVGRARRRGSVHTEGNVVAVERAADGASLAVMITRVSGETQVVRVPCPDGRYPDVRVGNYVRAVGDQSGDRNGYFVASGGLTVWRDGHRVQ